MSFQDVNDGLYNEMASGLGQSKGSFVLLQPCNPVLNNNALWNHYFNLIPPYSIFFNMTLSGGAQFFDNYNALCSALLSPDTETFEKAVPQAIQDAFVAYCTSRPTLPDPAQLPAVFRNWAFLTHPSIANTGASAYAAALLDPVFAMQQRVLLYQGDPNATPPVAPIPPDWDESYTSLTQQLAAGVSRSFSYSQSQASLDVSETWTHGTSSGFFGLFGGSSSSSSQSVTFSKSDFTVNASFKHVITFSPVPGAWFSSAGLAIAFNNKNKAPWIIPNVVTWDSAFDPYPLNGNLARFIVNLVVVDTMNVKVTSQAIFSQNDQTVIHTNSGGGLWPFYTSNSGNGAATTFSFDNQGHMTVQITSLPGVPIVLGANVLPVNQYIS